VVTINLPRIGFLAADEKHFFDRLSEMIRLAAESLEVKRKVIERFTEINLYPYSKYYLNEVRENTGSYWKNHFSTIGLIGMNEACTNFLGSNIAGERGMAFALEVMDFIRRVLSEIQEDTGDLYNLEATPAEGTSYRLALIDKKEFPEILCANEREYQQGAAPFYTNSTQLPVNHTHDIYEALLLQDELQTKYTGGTVFHAYLGEQISDVQAVKALVKKIVNRFRIPYFTLSPVFSVCPSHGYLNGNQERCSVCNSETEVYARIVGYLRPVKQWNEGKRAEFDLRKSFEVTRGAAYGLPEDQFPSIHEQETKYLQVKAG
jgi:anaerobic ribonucleoside-triphosphate reductase